ncbi:MAG: hypothetical protein M5R36_13125 [Deltaproteobacteria bacterium]|nr:hypothetical protein [Deltaproteobacteria bacterium]
MLWFAVGNEKEREREPRIRVANYLLGRVAALMAIGSGIEWTVLNWISIVFFLLIQLVT